MTGPQEAIDAAAAAIQNAHPMQSMARCRTEATAALEAAAPHLTPPPSCGGKGCNFDHWHTRRDKFELEPCPLEPPPPDPYARTADQ